MRVERVGMSCDYTIHIGDIPVKRLQQNPVTLMMGHRVELDYNGFDNKPSLKIGETSFLKAAITGDRTTYIPGVIDILVNMIPEYQGGETMLIDDVLIETVEKLAMGPQLRDGLPSLVK